MRQWGAGGLGLLAVLLGGCFSGSAVQRTSWMEQYRPVQTPLGPDVVQIDLALLERPLGDAYINKDLWLATDEQVVGLESRARLEDNGLRVGQIVGSLPADLRALLTSERSCANPRCRVLQAGKEATVTLSDTLPQCRFQLQQNGQACEVVLDQAQCCLVVVPTLTGDGRTRLQFTPKIQYGESSPDFHPAEDRSGWLMEVRKPSKWYPALSWEVTLAPKEYVVVGGCFEQQESLGYRCFVQDEGPAPVQRLLVLRTNRPGAALDQEPAEPYAQDSARKHQPPPLALQATWTAVRGSSGP
jgi:hypothetical protein